MAVEFEPFFEVAALGVACFFEECQAGVVGGGDVGVEAVEVKGERREVREFVQHGEGVSLTAVLVGHHDAHGAAAIQRVVGVKVDAADKPLSKGRWE